MRTLLWTLRSLGLHLLFFLPSFVLSMRAPKPNLHNRHHPPLTSASPPRPPSQLTSTPPLPQHLLPRLLPLHHTPHHLRRLAKIREKNVLDALPVAIRCEIVVAARFFFDEEDVGVFRGGHVCTTPNTDIVVRKGACKEKDGRWGRLTGDAVTEEEQRRRVLEAAVGKDSLRLVVPETTKIK